jgi:hypothetical protein
MFDQFLSWIGEQAGPLLEKLGDWGLQFVEWVAPKIPDILVAVAGIAAAILVWVGETALTLANKLIEWGPPFYDWVHAEAIPKLLTALGEMGGNIVGWITDTIKTAGDEAKKIGKSIIDGIKKSVEDKAKELWDAAKAAVLGALKAAKDALGIHSPSAVFADVVGAQIPAGIALGVVKATPAAISATVDAAGKLVDAVGKVVDTGMKALSAVGTYQGPGGSGMAGFVAGIAELATQIAGAATLVGTSVMASAQKFAESAGKVADFAVKGVDVLSKLGSLAAPAPGAIDGFVADLVHLIGRLADLATTVDKTGLLAAQQFADGGGKVLGILGAGVDALTKLASLGAAGRAPSFALPCTSGS